MGIYSGNLSPKEKQQPVSTDTSSNFQEAEANYLILENAGYPHPILTSIMKFRLVTNIYCTIPRFLSINFLYPITQATEKLPIHSLALPSMCLCSSNSSTLNVLPTSACPNPTHSAGVISTIHSSEAFLDLLTFK